MPNTNEISEYTLCTCSSSTIIITEYSPQARKTMPCSWQVRNSIVVLAVLLCQQHTVLVSAQPTTLLRANGIAVAPCSSSYTCWTCTTHFINVTQSTRGVTGCGWCASTKTCSTLTADGRAGRSCAVADTVRGGSDQCPRQLGTLLRSTLLQRRWMM